MQDSLPFLTGDLPGVGGVIKTRPEDFFVEELPSYEPSGSGTHVYAQIEKKGLGTREALDRIARALTSCAGTSAPRASRTRTPSPGSGSPSSTSSPSGWSSFPWRK